MATIEDLLRIHKITRDCTYKCAEGLSAEHASWKPSENARSIQETLLHIGMADWFWFSKLSIDVPQYPKTSYLSETMEYLRQLEEIIHNKFDNSQFNELTKLISTDRGDLSLVWALKRVTQHLLYHLGTLVYLRLILEPEWKAEAGLADWAKAVDDLGELIPVE